MMSIPQRYALRSVGSFLLWGIGVPVTASVIWAVGTSPFLWFYGAAIVIAFLPYTFFLSLGSAFWIAVRTYFAGGITWYEAILATLASVTVLYWSVDVTALYQGAERSNPTNFAGQLFAFTLSVSFALTGALATGTIAARLGIVRSEPDKKEKKKMPRKIRKKPGIKLGKKKH